MDVFFTCDPPLQNASMGSLTTDSLGWILELDNSVLDEIGGNCDFLRQFLGDTDYFFLTQEPTAPTSPDTVEAWARFWIQIWSAKELPAVLVERGLLDWWSTADRRRTLADLERLLGIVTCAREQSSGIAFACF